MAEICCLFSILLHDYVTVLVYNTGHIENCKQHTADIQLVALFPLALVPAHKYRVDGAGVNFKAQDRVARKPIKLTQGYREYWFQFCNFLVILFAYIVCPSVLNCSNLKLHQTLEVKNIFKQEKIVWVNV